MKSEEVNSNLAGKTVTVTPDKLIDKITLRKSGNVVTAILGISTSEIITMNQTLEIGQVPSEFKPSAFIYGMIGLTLNSIPAYFAISPSKTIYIRVRGNIQANVALYASFTYVI